MRRTLFLLIAIVLLRLPVEGQTLASDLLTTLRTAVSESADTTVSWFTQTEGLSFLSRAQATVSRLAGLSETYFDTSFQWDDTLGIVLPSAFRSAKHVKFFNGAQWEAAAYNPGFQATVKGYHYDVDRLNADTAVILFRGDFGIDQRVRITYFKAPDDFTALADTCELPHDLEAFIITEAYAYYLWSLRMFQEAELLRVGVRRDMGLQSQTEKR